MIRKRSSTDKIELCIGWEGAVHTRNNPFQDLKILPLIQLHAKSKFVELYALLNTYLYKVYKKMLTQLTIAYDGLRLGIEGIDVVQFFYLMQIQYLNRTDWKRSSQA